MPDVDIVVTLLRKTGPIGFGELARRCHALEPKALKRRLAELVRDGKVKAIRLDAGAGPGCADRGERVLYGVAGGRTPAA